ncbi:MAG: hypothetical protein IKP86_14575 [Anaerolineaceae bacterium]|nr:hypothetical protein [Anaerolineaceae bacterium]
MNIGWIIGFIIGLTGIVGHFVTLNPFSSVFVVYIARYNYYLLLAGFVIVSLSGNRRW